MKYPYFSLTPKNDRKFLIVYFKNDRRGIVYHYTKLEELKHNKNISYITDQNKQIIFTNEEN